RRPPAKDRGGLGGDYRRTTLSRPDKVGISRRFRHTRRRPRPFTRLSPRRCVFPPCPGVTGGPTRAAGGRAVLGTAGCGGTLWRASRRPVAGPPGRESTGGRRAASAVPRHGAM